MATNADNELLKEQINQSVLPYPTYREYVDTERQVKSFLAEQESVGDYEFIMSGSFNEGFPRVIDQSNVDFLRPTNETDPPINSKWHEVCCSYLEHAPAHSRFH